MYHEVGIYTILLLYTKRQVVVVYQEGGCIIMFQDRLVAIYLQVSLKLRYYVPGETGCYVPRSRIIL